MDPVPQLTILAIFAAAILGLAFFWRDPRVRARASMGPLPVAKRVVLTDNEQRIYGGLNELLANYGYAHRVLTQVAMGKIVEMDHRGMTGAKMQMAMKQLNSLRVDFLVVDARWMPICAIEYVDSNSGSDYDTPSGVAKRQALMRADLPLFLVTGDGLTPDVMQDVVALLDAPAWAA